MEAKKKRNRNILFGCVVGLFALGVALLPTILRSQQEEPADNASYLSTQVERRDILSTISGWGTLTDQEGLSVSVPRGVEVTEYLAANYVIESTEALAKKLNRTEKAIRNKASAMGLSKKNLVVE